MDIFAQLSINALISMPIISAMGFNLTYSTRKFVDMSHGYFAAVGGYAMYGLTRLAGWPFWPSLILSVLISAGLSWFADYIVYRPLRRQRAPTLVCFIASLGLMIVLQSLFAMFFSTEFWVVRAPSGFLSNVYPVFGAAITGIQILMISTMVVLASLVIFLLQRTNLGLSLRAVGDDPEVSAVIGVPVERTIGWSVALAGFLAGASGALAAVDTGVYPTVGLTYTLLAAASGIIGGLGSMLGAALGAVLIAVLANFGIWHIASGWQMAIVFGFLLLFLLFRPKGILSTDK